jgi:hypothetical protein
VPLKFTPVRVVCKNALTMPLDEGGAIGVRHDRDLRNGLNKAKALLGLIESTYDRLGHRFLAMVAARVVDAAVTQYLASLPSKRCR